MLTTQTFLKKTRRGNVIKIVREHYLRDDIYCGSSACTSCKHTLLSSDDEIEAAGNTPTYILLVMITSHIISELQTKFFNYIFAKCLIIVPSSESEELRPLAILSSQPNKSVSTKHSLHYLMIDTNIVLEEIDFLEDANGLQNVIILQTVLKEVRHRSTAIYKRLKDIISYKKRRFYVFLNEHHKGNCHYDPMFMMMNV